MKHFAHINALIQKFLKLHLWVYAILLIGGLCGCASAPMHLIHLTPVLDRPNIEKIYFDGRAFAFSFGEKSSVAVAGTINSDELILLVTCISHTERIDAIPEHIGVLGYSVNNQPVPLKVYTPTEYMAKRRNAQNLNLALQALSGAIDAQRASKSTSTTYRSDGETSYYAKTTTKNRAAADRVLRRHKRELRQTVESYTRSNAAVESRLLKAHTVFYDQTVGGIVIVKLLPARGHVVHDNSSSFSPTLPTGDYVAYSKFYSKVVITVPWVKEEPHQITLTR